MVLGGDFNAQPTEKAIRKVMRGSWADMTNADLSFPAWKPEIKIDYLFACPAANWHLVRTQTVHSLLSDHLPVVSDMIYVKKHGQHP